MVLTHSVLGVDGIIIGFDYIFPEARIAEYNV